MLGTWYSGDRSIRIDIAENTITNTQYPTAEYEGSGPTTYTLIGCKITASTEDTTTYEFIWDVDIYKKQHPRGYDFNPQPFIYKYQKSTDTMFSGVQMYRER